MSKKKIRKTIKISGKTTDGRLVVTGLFLFVGTLGLPLADVLLAFEEDNYVVDWIDFYEDALMDGYKSKTALNKIDEGIVDVFGKDYRDTLLAILNYYVKNRDHYRKKWSKEGDDDSPKVFV